MIVFIDAPSRGHLVRIRSGVPLRVAAAALLTVTALTACGGGDDEGGTTGGTLTVWSLENQTDRVDVLREVYLSRGVWPSGPDGA